MITVTLYFAIGLPALLFIAHWAFHSEYMKNKTAAWAVDRIVKQVTEP